MYKVVHYAAKWLFPRYFQWQVIGAEHLPSEGPLIVVSNHANYLDPIAMAAVSSRTLHFMGKEELFANPLAGWLLRKLGTFPVRRGRADRQAIRHALNLLEDGKVLAMFPEGTRSQTGELLELQRGAALLAVKSGAPVLPIVIRGAHEALADGRKFPRRGEALTVRIGELLQFGANERVNQAAITEASDAIEAAMEVLYELGHTCLPKNEGVDEPSVSINNGTDERKRYRSGQKDA